MSLKSLFYRKHKFLLQISRSSSDFYGSNTYRKFIYDNTKNEITKINQPFTIDHDLLNDAHKKILHSKIKSNPKYKHLEILSYSNNKEKDKKIKDFFLTTNKYKTIKNSRNISSYFKKIDESSISKNENKNNFLIYPLYSTNLDINIDKYYFNRNRNNNIKDFVNERKLVYRLRYINKIKSECKEKKEKEISNEIKLIDIRCKSLLKTKNLYEKYDTERNHYNRYLYNELLMNKQILLKFKIKKNQEEEKLLNLVKKIDILKSKLNILQDYKNFILNIKKNNDIINKFNFKTLDEILNKDKKEKIIINKNNLINENKILRRNSISFVKNNSSLPLSKRIFFNIKPKLDNITKKQTFKIRKSISENNSKKINNFIKESERKSFIRERINSEPKIFESSIDFNEQMKKIKDTLFTLLTKKNKLYSELIRLKLEREEEINDNKIKIDLDPKIKIYEELLNNYKEYNNDLTNKLNYLIKEKDDNTFNIIIFKKINEILERINKNYKEFKNNEIIFEKYKRLLIYSKVKYQTIKSKFVADGIIIIEHVMIELFKYIENYCKNDNKKKILNEIKLKIEKDKKIFIGRQNKDDIIKKLKYDHRIIEKMNKICFLPRKVPEKINFKKVKK